MTKLERSFSKLARAQGVSTEFYPFDRKFRRAVMNHPAWDDHYEFTYLPNQASAALAFLRWLVSHRLDLGWEVPPESGIAVMVPHMPSMDPRSDECRYSWSEVAWVVCENG